jgi:tRNA (cytidine/uridine-2'-O-)-methyltransferase
MDARETPEAERHVVLVAPEIHWNTGNIGRTCLAAGARLHLVRPLGFSLASREVRRAGLDYWEAVSLAVWDDFEAFLAAARPAESEVALFSARGPRSYLSMAPADRMFLVFGSETKGLPAALLARYPESVYHIPIRRPVRSLNLSTAVGIALYESLRAAPPFQNRADG